MVTGVIAWKIIAKYYYKTFRFISFKISLAVQFSNGNNHHWLGYKRRNCQQQQQQQLVLSSH